jgi:hypothetical protein
VPAPPRRRCPRRGLGTGARGFIGFQSGHLGYLLRPPRSFTLATRAVEPVKSTALDAPPDPLVGPACQPRGVDLSLSYHRCRLLAHTGSYGLASAHPCPGKLALEDQVKLSRLRLHKHESGDLAAFPGLSNASDILFMSRMVEKTQAMASGTTLSSDAIFGTNTAVSLLFTTLELI